jgi:hypothetical protein
MDDEAIGLFGVLLIAAALVMTQPLHRSHAMPMLPGVHWDQLASALGCVQDGGDGCEAALSR